MIDDKTILEIRQKRLLGNTYNQLSIEYQLPLCTIRAICKNKIGSHVPLGEESSNVSYKRAFAIGSQSGASILLEEYVTTIRMLINQGFPLKVIADLYRVSISCISDIKTGRSWQHLP